MTDTAANGAAESSSTPTAALTVPAGVVVREVGALLARETSRIEEEFDARVQAVIDAVPGTVSKAIGDALAEPLAAITDLITRAGQVAAQLRATDEAIEALARRDEEITEAIAGAVREFGMSQADAIEKSVGEGINRAVAGLKEQTEGDTRRALENERRAHELQDVLREAIASMPAPAKGDPGTPGTPGDPGAPGELTAATPWAPGPHVERACVVHDNTLWQAARATDSEPGTPGGAHAWRALVRGFVFRGLHDPARVYPFNSVVQASEGAAFIATVDIAPGVDCPGDGWALITKQGRTGKPGKDATPIKGDAGKPGEPGKPGKDGAQIADVRFAADGTRAVIFEMTDGARIEFVPDQGEGASLYTRGPT